MSILMKERLPLYWTVHLAQSNVECLEVSENEERERQLQEIEESDRSISSHFHIGVGAFHSLSKRKAGSQLRSKSTLRK